VSHVRDHRNCTPSTCRRPTAITSGGFGRVQTTSPRIPCYRLPRTASRAPVVFQLEACARRNHEEAHAARHSSSRYPGRPQAGIVKSRLRSSSREQNQTHPPSFQQVAAGLRQEIMHQVSQCELSIHCLPRFSRATSAARRWRRTAPLIRPRTRMYSPHVDFSREILRIDRAFAPHGDASVDPSTACRKPCSPPRTYRWYGEHGVCAIALGPQGWPHKFAHADSVRRHSRLRR